MNFETVFSSSNLKLPEQLCEIGKPQLSGIWRFRLSFNGQQQEDGNGAGNRNNFGPKKEFLAMWRLRIFAFH